MGWKAPLGYIPTTVEDVSREIDLSNLSEGILPDKSVKNGNSRIYSVKKGNAEKYLKINRFSYIDTNI